MASTPNSKFKKRRSLHLLKLRFSNDTSPKRKRVNELRIDVNSTRSRFGLVKTREIFHFGPATAPNAHLQDLHLGNRARFMLAFEQLEARLPLSFIPVGDPLIHTDPLLGVPQHNVRIAASPFAPADTFVTVFQTADRDGDGLGVFAQIHSPANVDTIQVNTTTEGDQQNPDVDIFIDGSFIVTWQGPATFGGDGVDVYFRRFDKDGNELTPESRVNTTVDGDQTNPAIAADSNTTSRFVIAWQGPGSDGEDIYAQFYSDNAQPDGAEITVNTTVAGDQTNPDVDVSDNFGRLATFAWEGPDADGTGIHARNFSQETANGDDFQVNPFAVAGDQRDPRVTVGLGTRLVSFIGPIDGATGVEGVFGARIGAALDGSVVVNDFLVSQGGLSPIGGHDVATVEQFDRLQFVFAWANGDQVTLSHFESRSFSDADAIPTFSFHQVLPGGIDELGDLSGTRLTNSNVSLVSTFNSTGNIFTDGLLLVSNPVVTTSGNEPARQTVVHDFDVTPEHLIANVDTGFPIRVVVFDDQDGDGDVDIGEQPLAGVTFFVDSNGNGIQDPLLPLEDFTATTDLVGETLIYGTGGLIPMTARLDSSIEVTTPTIGGLVTSFASPLGAGQRVADLGAFNPNIANFGDHARLIAATGTVAPLLRFVDVTGPIDASGLTFRSRSGDFLFFEDESSGKFRVFLMEKNPDDGKLQLFEPSFGYLGPERFAQAGQDEETQTLSFNDTTRQVEVKISNLHTWGLFPTSSIDFVNPPQLAEGEQLLAMRGVDVYNDKDGSLDVLLAVRKVDGSVVLRTYRNLPSGNEWADAIEISQIPGDDIRGVDLSSANLGASNGVGGDSFVDIVVTVRTGESEERLYIPLVNQADGTFSSPIVAASSVHAGKQSSTVVNGTLNSIADVIHSLTGGSIRLLAGSQSQPPNPPGIDFGIVSHSYSILDATTIDGIASVGDKVMVAADTALVQLATANAPILVAGFTNAVGLGTPSEIPKAAGGRVTLDDGRGIDGVILRAIDADGNVVAETQTTSVDIDEDGKIESDETGIYQLPLGLSEETLKIVADLTGGLGFNPLQPNFDFVSPVDGEHTVDVQDCPCNNLNVILADARFDYGDAPDSYGTLEISNGAKHLINPAIRIGGEAIDGETDGQPSVNARGDDNRQNDDESGILFGQPIASGTVVDVNVISTIDAVIDAFIDYNADGDFTDPGERLFPGGHAVGPNNNVLQFTVPADATPGTSYARFRLSTEGGLGPTGAAPDGEVEDLAITIVDAGGFDFGDAPTAAQSGFTSDYPTESSAMGASHQIVAGGPFLGSQPPDSEADGQPTTDADGDDETGNDDEDGVLLTATMIASPARSNSASVLVTVDGIGKLDGWIDFNADGDWIDSGEQVFDSIDLADGQNVLTAPIPTAATAGVTYARFRYSTNGGTEPTGAASDGEVEDVPLLISSSGDLSDAEVLFFQNATIEMDTLGVRSGAVDLFRAGAGEFSSLSVQGSDSSQSILIELANGPPIPTGGLVIDGAGGSDSIVLVGDGMTLDMTTPMIDIRNINHVDLSHDDQNTITIDASSISELDPENKTLLVTGGEGDEVHVTDADQWRLTEPISGGTFLLTASNDSSGGQEQLQANWPHPWQNFIRASDVNNDGQVAASDALRIINELARREFSERETEALMDPADVTEWPGAYFDQNGDDEVTALDALRVINELADQLSERSPGEQPAPHRMVASLPSQTKLRLDEVVASEPELATDLMPANKVRSFQSARGQTSTMPTANVQPIEARQATEIDLALTDLEADGF